LIINRKALPLLIAVLAVNLMSLTDAISTLLLMDNECVTETNPLINTLMEHDYLSYFGVKLLLTLLGTVICWHYYEHRVIARRLFNWISRIYCTLMVWHVVLLSMQ
jgi:hypothetical protein